ncbi:MAG TPA: hypothetical protein PLX56_12335 [bacterium]|nr:hypothetical protein [bacterium]HQO93106.1 hypothetical protein [bacterium]
MRIDEFIKNRSHSLEIDIENLKKKVEEGATGIHLFTMGKGKSAKALFERIKTGV